jgi:MFS family permease
MGASGVGALLGNIAAGYLGAFERKGLLLIGGSTAYGACLVLFAQSELLPASLAILFLSGCCSSVYMITLQTTLQMRVPDELRGRVMGVYGMTHNIGPLGTLLAGLIADTWGAPAAVSVSGFAIMAFALGVASSKTEVRRLQSLPAAG